MGGQDADIGRCLLLTWREAGGPPVSQPKRTGLGTELISRGINFELDGNADIDYRPEGIIVILTIPMIGQEIRVVGDVLQ